MSVPFKSLHERIQLHGGVCAGDGGTVESVTPSDCLCPFILTISGQEIEVHYRWHPLYGRRIKVRDIKQRVGGRVGHIEAVLGIARVVPEWMPDAVAFSAMEPGGFTRG
jgi:hypothetical protein